MKWSWRKFAVWAAVLSALAILANWPRGSAKLAWAGVPWVFATWLGGRLDKFEFDPFVWDLGVAIVVILALAKGEVTNGRMEGRRRTNEDIYEQTRTPR
jgi:hypothetical protein